MSDVRIKTWLYEDTKLVVNEREDDLYHESYWVWPKPKDGRAKVVPMIPVLVGHLKKLQQGQDCIFVGWAWTVDLKHLYVKTVMDNPILRNALVQKLKQIINNQFRIDFLPNDNSFTGG